MDECAEYIEELPAWAVEKLDEILGFTAPEMQRLKLLSLMVDLVAAADGKRDVE